MKNKADARLVWVEWIKAIALGWIFLNHVAERVFGYPWIANPSALWPPLAERIAQLAPLHGYGAGDIVANLFRYVGWFGDQGVQLFLIVSGFGLTWGMLLRGATETIPVKEFYVRRLFRIYPLWWGAHILFFATWLFTGKGLPFIEINSILSFLGLRVTPASFYFFSPAWWYFALILQLYLIFPLLWRMLQRWGAVRFFLIVAGISFIIRGAGLLIFTTYLDVWQRGGIFVTRLPEFVFGMALAATMFANREATEKRLVSLRMFISAVGIYAVGIVLSVDLLGMTLAPFLLGLGAFLVFYNLLARALVRFPGWVHRVGEWVGAHSYSLYLMHHPVVNRLIPEGMPLSPSLGFRIAAAALGTLGLALALEYGVFWVESMIRRSLHTRGLRVTIIQWVGMGVILWIALLGSEFAVRQFAPQEIFGWGERPSLEKSEEFGWRLIPGATTRLRWQSYDYTVSANSLGFPGTEYPPEKPQGVYRILVTGDAFSSAEGVNTEASWVRQLETMLSKRTGQTIQVLNFAVTGYGPNQYEAVVRKFVPIYQPDLVIVEMFVNDFDDALLTNEQFQYSIGFDQPSQTGLMSYLRLEHLRNYLRYDVFEPLMEIVSKDIPTKGYFFGYFSAFETGRQEELRQASMIVQDRLAGIKQTASKFNASLLVIVVPASVQVCRPEDLEYYPRNVDFSNPAWYDPEFPQRLFFEISQTLELSMLDLRAAFSQDLSECPYQVNNLHWTEYGHQKVAEFLTEFLAPEGNIGVLP